MKRAREKERESGSKKMSGEGGVMGEKVRAKEGRTLWMDSLIY